MADRSLRLAALLALGTLSFPIAAHAATQITLGGTAGGITLTGTGTTVNVTIAAGTGTWPAYECPRRNGLRLALTCTPLAA